MQTSTPGIAGRFFGPALRIATPARRDSAMATMHPRAARDPASGGSAPRAR